MNKKIIVLCTLAVFMIVAISISTAVQTNDVKKAKSSPIFGFELRNADGRYSHKSKFDYLKDRLYLRVPLNTIFKDEDFIGTIGIPGCPTCVAKMECLTVYYPVTFYSVICK